MDMQFSPGGLMTGFFMLLLSSLLVSAQNVNPPTVDNGWLRGRATFYDGPPSFLSAYSVRGEGSYGDILYGSCGFFQTRRGTSSVTYEDLPYPKDQVAALANIDPDYPGSCGRCYEVRCSPGLVIANGTTPIKTSDIFYQAAVNRTVKDTYGRSFPGNSAENQGELSVTCWNTDPVLVRVADNCPQYQNKNGIVTAQSPCNGDVYHFDLSYWAFEKLAHPVYGLQMVDFRPVSCLSQQQLQFLPGFVNKTVYDNGIQTGWGWHPYTAYETRLNAGGGGLNGDSGTCIANGPNGGVTFECRECNKTGYQPFARAQTLSLAVRADDSVLEASDGSTATSVGSVPPLTVYLGAGGSSSYCNNQVSLTSQSSTGSQSGGWFTFDIPLSAFSCPDLSQVDQLGLQNKNGQVARYCVDNVVILPTTS